MKFSLKYLLQSLRKKNYGDRISSFKTSENITFEPNIIKSKTCLNKGFSILMKGNYEEAIKIFINYLEKNPYEASAYHYLGDCFAEIGEEKTAYIYYKKAIELDKDYMFIFFYRGKKYMQKNKLIEAINDFSKLIELVPEFSSTSFYYRGLCYKSNKQFEEAINDFTKAIKKIPYYSFAYYNRGESYDKLNEHDKAISDFKKAGKLNLNFKINPNKI